MKPLAKPDPLAQPGDIAAAFALLTRLPVTARNPRGAPASWAWPLAGAMVGLIAALTGWIGLAFGLPIALVALLVIGTEIALTGGLHEDGLADVADGFWGGHDTSRRLEIMKDSRIGSYGVLVLGLSLLARTFALIAIFETGALFAPLIAVAALSRAPMAVLMAAMPNARGHGLSDHVGRPTQATATLGVLIALAIAWVFLGGASLAPVFWATLGALGVAALAKTKIGGQTGDVLGATQQVTQVVALAALAASA